MPIPSDSHAPGDTGHVTDHNSIADVLTGLTAGAATETSRAQTAEAGLMSRLTQAAAQTSAYTASANQVVPVNTTSGSITITLPTAPPAGTLVAVKQILQGTGNTVTVTCGGSDVLNKTGGGTSMTLTLLNQGVLLAYAAGIWVNLADDLPLSQLDLRYANLANPALTGTPTAPTAAALTNSIQIATTAYTDSAVRAQVFNPMTYGAVGDGTTDDTTAFNAAITAANAAGGGIVPVPKSASPYIFNGIVVKSNVTLRGDGGILKFKSGATVSSSTAYYPISTLGSPSNVRYIDLIIDGNQANNLTGTFAVCDMITASGENVEIRGCHIYNAVDSGIMFSNVTNSACSGNRIDGATDLGIYMNDTSVGTPYGTLANENVISGNRISHCVNGGIAAKRGFQRFVLRDNQIYNCGNGFTLEQNSVASPEQYSMNCTISGNRFRTVGYAVTVNGFTGPSTGVGIDIRGADNVICTGNRIEDPYNDGITLQSARYCVVSGNLITFTGSSSGTGRGIALYSRPDAALPWGPVYNTLVGNMVTGPYYACHINGASGQLAQHNRLAGNTFISTGSYALVVGSSGGNNFSTGNFYQGATTDVSLGSTTVGLCYSDNDDLYNGTFSGAFQRNTLRMSDGRNMILGTVTGSKIGTATSQLLGFYNATPIVQPVNSNTARQALQALGLLAAGGADVPSSVPAAANFGMTSWTTDPGAASGTNSLVVATNYVMKLYIAGTRTISNVLLYLSTAGVTAASSYFALYDSSGNYITGSQSADVSSTWNGTAGNNKTFALGNTTTVTDTFVYLSMWVNSAGTPPVVLRAGSVNSGNMGTSSGTASATSPRWGTAANAYTSSGTVAPSSLGSITLSVICWIIGVS